MWRNSQINTYPDIKKVYASDLGVSCIFSGIAIRRIVG